jgi:hypothetical protein
MPRTVTDEEYAWLKGKETTANFVESIYNDPQLNKEAKQLIKKKYPNLAIPDYDLEKKIDDKFAARDKQIADAREKAQQERHEKTWKQKREETQKGYGFTDEAMEKLERLMVERNIGDYEAGAMLMASKEPKTADAHYETHLWNHQKKPGWQEIAKDPEGWGSNEILQAIYKDQERLKGR